MKKYIFLFIFGFFLCAMFINIVNAQDCRYGMPSPVIWYNGSYSNDTVHDYDTTASSCLATNTAVYFSNGAFLPAVNFDLIAYLMEDDVYPNEDEYVKKYKGHNNGYTLISWTFVTIMDNGNLDSAGDQTCEFYLKVGLSEPLANNNVEHFNSDLFRYSVCLN